MSFLTPGQVALGDQCKAEADRLLTEFIDGAKRAQADGIPVIESFGLCASQVAGALQRSETAQLNVAYVLSAAVHRLAFPEQAADHV